MSDIPVVGPAGATRAPRPLSALFDARTVMAVLAHATAWLIGAVIGFGFGLRVSGVALGVVTSLLTGLCLSLLLDAAIQGAERLGRLWKRRCAALEN
jgi:hypothetical protein